MSLLLLDNLTCDDLYDTGSFNDKQDPAIRLVYNNEVFMTERSKDTGINGSFKEKFTINLVPSEDIITIEVLNVGTTLMGGKKEVHVGKGKINIRDGIHSDNTATSLVIPLVYEPKSYKKGFVRMTGMIKSATSSDTQPKQGTGSSNDVKLSAPETVKKVEAAQVSGGSVASSSVTSANPETTNKKVNPASTSAEHYDDEDDDELKILPVNGSQKYFITKITAKDIKSVELIGSNDNYLLLNIGNKWSAETTVLEGSGSTASWTYVVDKDKQMTIELSNQEVCYFSSINSLILNYLITYSVGCE